MIRSEVKMSKEICSDDSVFNIGNCKAELEISLPNSDCASDATVTTNFRTVGGAKLRAGWS